ncbi:UNVERIFIED_CONTAM: hypothetical protein Sradi_4409000 [Sesamum radiatum]|uniref:Uncharacterized protein n=1 Tax=Sesamum radiatum TaxID=300843 RepID=A0AAW2NS25_SESRA
MPSLATALADSKHRRRSLLKRNRLALKLLGGVPNTPRHSPLKQFAKTQTLKHSAPHICLLLAHRVAPRSRPYVSLGKRPRNDFNLADSIPTPQKVPIRTVLQSPIGKSLCSRAVRALACRSASPSRPHIVRTSQPTVLPKVRPVTFSPLDLLTSSSTHTRRIDVYAVPNTRFQYRATPDRPPALSSTPS